MEELDPNDKILVSRAELKQMAADAVRQYMEQEHVCDLSIFSPDELEGIIDQFDDKEMHWGKDTMRYLLNQYGKEGRLHGRDDLQQFATKILRFVDKEDGLDWKRHFSKHERNVISRGDTLAMTRRTFIPTFFCGSIGAGFTANGVINGVASHYDIETYIEAPRERDAFRRMLQDLKRKSDIGLDPKAETAVGALLIYEAVEKWNEAKKHLLAEKLEHIADAAQELYERTQERQAAGAGLPR